MKFLSYNIQYGKDQDGKYNLYRIAQIIKEADVACIQEVEKFWQRSGFVDQTQILSELLPNYYSVFGPALDMDASLKNEYGQIANRRRQFGNMIFSKFPIISSRNFPLPKTEYCSLETWISDHSIQRAVLEVVIDIPGINSTRVYSTHLSHRSLETRLPQVKFLQKIINQAPYEQGAWSGDHSEPIEGWTEGEKPPMPEQFILMGDMNFAFGSKEYKVIVDYKKFYDAWTSSDTDRGTNVDGDSIDHCFVSKNLLPKIKRTYIDRNITASDHWPLWMEMDAKDKN
jgi:endonuclease/exonuclease/phosphatase family metal-dependent hydrolase